MLKGIPVMSKLPHAEGIEWEWVPIRGSLVNCDDLTLAECLQKVHDAPTKVVASI